MPKYQTLNSYLKNKFGCRVYKVSVDGGFSCPNRDGTKSLSGCIFCDETGSSSRTHEIGTSITKQIQKNIIIRKSRYKAKKFIAYFQSYTNTYASLKILKKRYDEAINAHEDIIGLSIATRADCIDEKKLSLIASYLKKVPYVCMEYGMQSIHDSTLKVINRQETHQDFLRAFKLTHQKGLEHCVHVILGLPGETYSMQMQTADTLANLGIRGIKIHVLTAMKNTLLAKKYREGAWQPLSYEEYIQLVVDFIKRLPKGCVIHRFAGNGHPEFLEAPRWAYTRKKEMLQTIKSFF